VKKEDEEEDEEDQRKEEGNKSEIPRDGGKRSKRHDGNRKSNSKSLMEFKWAPKFSTTFRRKWNFEPPRYFRPAGRTLVFRPAEATCRPRSPPVPLRLPHVPLVPSSSSSVAWSSVATPPSLLPSLSLPLSSLPVTLNSIPPPCIQRERARKSLEISLKK